MNRMLTVLAAGSALATLSLAGPVSAQELSAVLAGYGSANYRAVMADGETPNDFTASVSPILLFQAGEDLLFETEMEFELEGDATEIALEYAQIDYLGFDRLQVTAGKFLLPFGVFGERLHPTWINKMPDAPPIYGHAHGGIAEGAILPVLSDAGLMLRYAQPLGGIWKFDLSAWVSQGPRTVDPADGEGAGDDGHAHALAPANGDDDHGGSAFGVPDVAFGTSFGDNNDNKMLGARVGLVRGGGFEAYLSGFHAMIDPDDFLDLTGFNLAVEFRRGSFEARGEAVLTRQEFVVEETSYETLEKRGFYVQAARRFGDLEPVVRYARILDAEVDGATAIEGSDRIDLGVAWWLTPTVPLKAAYGIDPDGDDRVMLQWAFGF